MTNPKGKLEKLEKIIKPKQNQGRKVKVKVQINSIYGIDEQDQVIEMRENQVEEMDRVLTLVYGDPDQEEKGE